jgi:uncharacterized protein involved in exopolysaccharide biosynthesis
MVNSQLNPQQLPQQPMQANHADNEIDLREFFRVLWTEKWLIIGITSAAAVISIVVSLMMTEVYRAEAILAAADTEQGTGGLAAQFGGTASLLGVNIGGSGGNTISNAIATLRSRQFIGRFINENNLLVPLFASSWDKSEQRSVIDEKIYNTARGEWVLQSGAPSGLDAYRAFSAILTVDGPDRQNSLVTVAISWHNPVEAAEWVNRLVAALNQEIRMRDINEANNAIRYLSQQLETTQLVDMQRVFYQLIESQTRTTMLADIREEYLFRVIDPAVAPDNKILPNRTLILIIGSVLGLFISIFLVLIKNVYRVRASL